MLNKITAKIGFSENGFIRYLKNTVWMFAEFGFTLIVSLFVGLAAAKYLGPEFYGVMVFSLTLYAVSSMISGFGFESIAIRDALKDESKIGPIYGTLMVTKIITTIALFLISVFILNAKYDGMKFYAGLFIVSSLLLQPINVLKLFFNMKVQAKYVSIANISSASVSAILKILFIIFGKTVEYFALTVFIDAFITGVLLLFFYLYNKNDFKSWTFDKSYFKFLFKSNWPLIIIVIVGAIYSRVNIFMISKLLGDKEVGIYGVALRLTDVFYSIPEILITSLFPAIMAAKISSMVEYEKRIKSFLRLLVTPFILVSFLTYLLGPWFINTFLGAQFAASSFILIILIWTIPLNVFYVVTMRYLTVENFIFKSMLRPLIALILIIIFNYLFFMKFQSLEAFAYSNILAYFIAFFLMDVIFSDSRRLFLMKIDSVLFPFKYIINLMKKRNSRKS